jgi:hypothetical protein
LLESAHITFVGKGSGALVFCSVEADLDVRYGSRDGAACAEFLRKVPTTIRMPVDAAGGDWHCLTPPRTRVFIQKADARASSPNTSDLFNSLLMD